jgi:hypothetical protein
MHLKQHERLAAVTSATKTVKDAEDAAGDAQPSRFAQFAFLRIIEEKASRFNLGRMSSPRGIT